MECELVTNNHWFSNINSHASFVSSNCFLGWMACRMGVLGGAVLWLLWVPLFTHSQACFSMETESRAGGGRASWEMLLRK